jgi:hypothetical protein
VAQIAGMKRGIGFSYVYGIEKSHAVLAIPAIKTDILPLFNRLPDQESLLIKVLARLIGIISLRSNELPSYEYDDLKTQLTSWARNNEYRLHIITLWH